MTSIAATNPIELSDVAFHRSAAFLAPVRFSNAAGPLIGASFA
jgi:hypothetical protein